MCGDLLFLFNKLAETRLDYLSNSIDRHTFCSTQFSHDSIKRVISLSFPAAKKKTLLNIYLNYSSTFTLIMTFADVLAPKRAVFSNLKSSKATKAGCGSS